jgi:catechol 2,3-dioxygenase
MPSSFFHSIEFTELTLRVHAIREVASFYRKVLGFDILSETPHRVSFSPPGGSTALIVLDSAPDAHPRLPDAAGLFHVAILLPDRGALGRMARNLAEHGIRLGAADHGVSEALYLSDPEGNGLEIYADRSPNDWPPPNSDGQVGMFTDALDFESVLAEGRRVPGPLLPRESRIGHVHLSVSALDRAEEFYGRTLGFPVRQRTYPGALFLGRDGYHHHIGANTWQSRAPAVEGSLGLAHFTMRFTATDEFGRVANRLRGSDRPIAATGSEIRATDPDNLAVRLVVRPS